MCPLLPCAVEPGFVSWYELKDYIARGARVTVDRRAKAAYLVLGDQWVSFDTPQTLGWKLMEAVRLKLGGTMVRGSVSYIQRPQRQAS